MPKRKRDPQNTNPPDHEHITSPGKRPALSRRPPQVHYDEAISHMDAAMLSDHLAQTLKRHATQRSTIELEDQFIPASAIRNTASFSEARVSKHLPLFLQTLSGSLEDLRTCADVASPHTIVVTSSGIRAADLTRDLRVLATGGHKIAKLFAKHMKLHATIDFVQKNKIIVGVGTPSRLKELIDHDAIKAAAIKRIIIDGSYVDEKKRTIFDLPEIYLPMLDFLNTAMRQSRTSTHPAGLEIAVF